MTVESAMSIRLGRQCLHVPSARLGLYLALRHWFSPGDRLLLAPTNCETVLFVILAAGLNPVMAPISTRDGNIDLAKVDWAGLSGVLTTHLYGQPDQVVELEEACRSRGLTLIDDAAHALGIEVAGRPLGTFGDVGVLSLAKHARAMSGGFLTSADTVKLAEANVTRDALLQPGAWQDQILGVLRPMAREAITKARLVRPVWQAMTSLGITRWTGHRLPLREQELRSALRVAGSDEDAALTSLNRWLSIDLTKWRMRQAGLLRHYQMTRLRAADRERERRITGVRVLRTTPWAAEGVRQAEALPLLRVPLLVSRRDDVVRALERRGVVPGFIYAPPLDDYLTGIDVKRPAPTPVHARWWTRHVLPVDPLRAHRMVRLLTELGTTPARVPDDLEN
ncbi:DegT/DnrJ/EryC1/StrS family aminotransferase [Nonomuraea sp. NPDC046802]|uniref:DegT/DnrJ/EryC1/StrS family aminotransferase n=1 Tax=Nonomuraea sp. NPDC046802 TaxID=3154919 RepID=UPI0033C2A35C